MDERSREALLKEYGEVSTNFRLLTDIRFKLLAFLPIAAAATAALRSDNASLPGLALSLFGLVVTLGLVTYNKRNDQLYNELVGRAAALERSLGLPDRGFANRPRAWLVVRRLGKEWRFDHGTGVSTIYVASIAFWLFGVLASLLELVRLAYLALFSNPSVPALFANPSVWVNLTAFGLAVLLTWWAARSIRFQSEQRSRSMRNSARKAVERAIVESAMPQKLRELRNDHPFLQSCEDLSGDNKEKIQARLDFYASLSQDRLDYYMPRSSDERFMASHLVALLTDMPPQWVFDCATDRKGLMQSSIYPAAQAPSNQPSQQPGSGAA